jgi:hypothetical protein
MLAIVLAEEFVTYGGVNAQNAALRQLQPNCAGGAVGSPYAQPIASAEFRIGREYGGTDDEQ